MGDLILLAGFLALVWFGYLVMAKLDRFLAAQRGDRRPFLSGRFRGRSWGGWCR